ncbi:MAG: class I SAM-dependent methyltransferase, partial [Myxococcales bacterium]
GEGGDALWLAGHGWRVTATDISRRALDRISAAANDQGVQVAVHQADANARDPFGGEQFDLVTAAYASLPRTPDGRGEANLLDAVAPGGLLLVINHDMADMLHAGSSHGRPQAFDPQAFVQTDDLVAAINAREGWEIEIHESRSRPPGAVSTHHVNDVVLRARRR